MFPSFFLSHSFSPRFQPIWLVFDLIFVGKKLNKAARSSVDRFFSRSSLIDMYVFIKDFIRFVTFSAIISMFELIFRQEESIKSYQTWGACEMNRCVCVNVCKNKSRWIHTYAKINIEWVSVVMFYFFVSLLLFVFIVLNALLIFCSWFYKSSFIYLFLQVWKITCSFQADFIVEQKRAFSLRFFSKQE